MAGLRMFVAARAMNSPRSLLDMLDDLVSARISMKMRVMLSVIFK